LWANKIEILKPPTLFGTFSAHSDEDCAFKSPILAGLCGGWGCRERLLCGAAVFREKIAGPRTDTVVSADRVVEDSLEAYANTAFDADTRLPVDVYHALGKTIRETLERDFCAAKPNPARGRPCPKPAEVIAGAQGTAPNNGVPSSSNPPNL
jgi:hypothetical protein